MTAAVTARPSAKQAARGAESTLVLVRIAQRPQAGGRAGATQASAFLFFGSDASAQEYRGQVAGRADWPGVLPPSSAGGGRFWTYFRPCPPGLSGDVCTGLRARCEFRRVLGGRSACAEGGLDRFRGDSLVQWPYPGAAHVPPCCACRPRRGAAGRPRAPAPDPTAARRRPPAKAAKRRPGRAGPRAASASRYSSSWSAPSTG